MDVVKIEYFNSCDLNDIYYSGGFRQALYLDADVEKPDYSIIEEGTEDGCEFILEKLFIKKQYNIVFTAPEHIVDALSILSAHDTVNVVLPNGDNGEARDITFNKEWVIEGCYADITLSFWMKCLAKTNCCENLDGIDCYEKNVEDVIDYILSTDAIYTDPIANGVQDGDRYLVERSLSGLGVSTTVAVYAFDVATSSWIDQGENIEGNIAENIASGTLYYCDGVLWNEFPTISAVTTIDATTVNVIGYCPPNTFVQLQYRQSGVGNYTDLGNPVLSGVYNSSGITEVVPLFEGQYDFRVYCYTFGCDYGYSNIITQAVWELLFTVDQPEFWPSFNVALKGNAGQQVTIVWGDGTADQIVNFTGATQTFPKNYATDGVFVIRIYGDLNDLIDISISFAEMIEAQMLAELNAIEDIVFTGNQLTSFTTFDEWATLVILDISDNDLEAITISDQWTNLEQLLLFVNQLDEIDIPDTLVNLEQIQLNSNNLTEIEVHDTWVSLTHFFVPLNNIDEINLPNTLVNMQEIFVSSNNLAVFSVPSTYVNLTSIICNSTPITVFTIDAAWVNLSELQIAGNQLSSVVVPAALTALTIIIVQGNGLTTFTIPVTLVAMGVIFADSNALNAANVDNMFINYDAAGAGNPGEIINVSGGTNAAPTGASAVARAAIAGRGVTIITN